MTNYLYSDFSSNIRKMKISKYILSLFVMIALSSLIDTYFTIEKTPISQMSDWNDKIKPSVIIYLILFVLAILKVIFSFCIYYFFFNIISFIFKKSTSKKDISKSIIFLIFCNGLLKVLILIIQYLFDINSIDYNIASLNVFSPENNVLESISIPLILNAYIISVITKKIVNISNLLFLLPSIIYLLVVIGYEIFIFLL